MGVYYYYVNLTKKEKFCIDTLGGSLRHRGLGRTLASRAFHLMLDYSKGRWAGDYVAVMGDDNTPDWSHLSETLTDIDAIVILTLFYIDGFKEIGEIAKHDRYLFMQLCHLVVTRQALELEPLLLEYFGASYLKKYKELCKELYYLPKDLTLRENETLFPKRPQGSF